MLETLPDKNLIQQYLQGDEKSLEILVARYLKPVYSFVYKNVSSQADAEDITQQVFIRIWKNLKKFDQKKDFKPWIFQIAKNASIDFLRKKKSIPFYKFEDEKGRNFLAENLAAKPLDLIESLSNKKTLALATVDLSEKDRKIINLRHYEEMSFKEIAEFFEESVNTIKSRYRRTMISIKNNIKNI